MLPCALLQVLVRWCVVLGDGRKPIRAATGHPRTCVLSTTWKCNTTFYVAGALVDDFSNNGVLYHGGKLMRQTSD